MKQAVADQDVAPIRFIGLDVHKHYAVAAGVDDRQHIILNPRRIELNKLGNWATKALQPTDLVVLEAMWNTWELYDQLTPLVAAVVVANPARTSRMKEPGVKTDAGDAVFLARLLGWSSAVHAVASTARSQAEGWFLRGRWRDGGSKTLERQAW